MLDCAAHILVALATALSWLGLGSIVLAPLRTTAADSGLDALNRFGAGAIVVSLLTFLAGWGGLLYTAAYVPLLVAGATAGAVAIVRVLPLVPRPRPRRWPRWQLTTALLIAAYAVAGAVVTCAPISSADALFYHAALPEQFERLHRIEEVPWSWGSYQPFSVQMLVLDGFLFGGATQGAFAPLLLGFGAAAAVFLIGYRLGGRGVALLATAVFFAQPFALWLSTSTFVEPGGAFVVALAVANLVRFREQPGIEPLVLAGAFTGAAAGIKYIGAGAAAVVALTALLALRRRLSRRFIAVFTTVAALVALPWYAKNAILVGDPAYPLLLGWPNEEARRAAQETFDNFGYGRSVVDVALLPVRLLAEAEPFNRAEYITPLFLLFAPLSLLARRVRGIAAVLLAGTAAYVALWFYGVQDSRYLFFAMPVLAILAAFGIVGLADHGRVGRVVAATVTAGALAAGAAVSSVYASQFVPVAFGLESDDEFLAATVSYHEATIWLNRNLPPDARVALGHVFVLQVDPPAIAWTSEALTTTAGPVETRAFFARYGITHALVFSTDASRRRQLSYVDASIVEHVQVHAVTSRALSRRGPAEMMVVYRVPTAR